MWAEFLVKHKKATIVGGVVTLIVIIAISVYFIMDNLARTATVKIIVAPSIATVKIGEEEFASYGEFRIRPGEYAVEISAEGFLTKEIEIEAAEGETTEVKLYLEAEEGNNYYSENAKDATILGDLKAAETQQKVDELKEEYPILEKLPIKIDFYTNDYSKRVKYTITYQLEDGNNGFVIVISDYTGGNYESALEKLTARGAKLEDYEIRYENLSDTVVSGRAE